MPPPSLPAPSNAHFATVPTTQSPSPSPSQSQSSAPGPSPNIPPRRLPFLPLIARCPCAHTTFSLLAAPLIVHACHCTFCQRESGSAFALNALYEPSLIALHSPSPTPSSLLRTTIPTASAPDGQLMVRCPVCYTVVWSVYAVGGGLVSVRVGTVDGVECEGRWLPNGGLVPDAHIFAGAERHQWVELGQESVVFERYGKKDEYWPKESLERLERFLREGRGEMDGVEGGSVGGR